MLEMSAVALSLLALWIMLLAQRFPSSINEVILFIPLYGLVSLGCYALGLLGYGVMVFPTCDSEAANLQKDIAEAKEYLHSQGIPTESAKEK